MFSGAKKLYIQNEQQHSKNIFIQRCDIDESGRINFSSLNKKVCKHCGKHKD